MEIQINDDNEKLSKVWRDINAIEFPDVKSEASQSKITIVKGILKQAQQALGIE